jgi:hypothetical protein
MKLRNYCIDYSSKLKLDYSIRLHPSSKTENLSIFIKSLKMKRSFDIDDIQKTWSATDCNYDSKIEFYCNGRLPVFNEWISENAKCVSRQEEIKIYCLIFISYFKVFPTSLGS